MVEIEHPQDVRTIFAHLSATSETIEVGQGIAAGEEIGSVGSTGTSTAPHLHYEVVVDGRPVPPLTYERLRRTGDEARHSPSSESLLDEARLELVHQLALDGFRFSQNDG